MLRSSMPSKSTLGRNQESVNLLQKQIEAVEKEMALLVSKHKPLLEAVKRAVSIPGYWAHHGYDCAG
ncbi:MAG: hypothetical protein IPM47_09980 [Sphingobacteriales bacterium]|nr:MAG: hypothetical protein IPM47_09980 [Sphingobacteriales bacterium]